MTKFFKSLPYHFKTAFSSIVRHFSMTFSSSSAVTVTLTLFMLFLVIAGNISNFTYSIEDSLQIYATIEPTVADEEIAGLQQRIEGLDHVVNVTFSDKEQEKEKYFEGRTDEASQKLYEAYSGDGNPFYHAFKIEVDSGENLASVNQALNSMEELYDAAYGGESVMMLVKAMDGIRIAGGAIVAALSILAIFLISNTIKSAIYARNNEIAIMRNVGATNGFIKMPFMIEGMIIGMIGSVIPILIILFGYPYMFNAMNGSFLIPMFKLQETMPFTLYISGIILVTGMVVGILGSFFAVNKYLRWKR